MSAFQEALQLVPDNDNSKPVCLNDPSFSLHARFVRLGERSILSGRKQYNSLLVVVSLTF